MPLARDPAELIKDLAAVGATLTQPITHPDLELLTRLTPLQPRHPQRKKLDARLTAALRGETDERLGTGWPWEQSDEFGAVDTVRLLHVPRAEDVVLPWLSIDDLKQIVGERPSRNPLDLLRSIKVMLMGDDETSLSPQIPALKWIAFETRIDDKLYFFHDGRWFAVAHDYESQVRTEAARILANRSTLTMPAWPKKQDEKDYNHLVARHDRRYLALDRKLIRTAVHPRGMSTATCSDQTTSSSTSSAFAARTTPATSSRRSTSPSTSSCTTPRDDALSPRRSPPSARENEPHPRRQRRSYSGSADAAPCALTTCSPSARSPWSASGTTWRPEASRSRSSRSRRPDAEAPTSRPPRR